MASFAAYAVLGIAFFQFGVGIAAEREEPWESYPPDAAGVRRRPLRREDSVPLSSSRRSPPRR